MIEEIDDAELVSRLECRVHDIVYDLLYYDRKNDEELTVLQVEYLFANHLVNIDKLSEIFKQTIKKGFEHGN